MKCKIRSLDSDGSYDIMKALMSFRTTEATGMKETLCLPWWRA